MPFLTHPFRQRLPLGFLFIRVFGDYARLAEHLEVLRVSDHLALLDGPLLGLLLFLWGVNFASQVLDDDGAVVDPADHVFHVVTPFKFALREGALEEATLFVP